MTPEEIAARLPELTGAAHDDAAIVALAQITAEAIRALNHATFPPAGPVGPATVYAVLGQLTLAVYRLPQLSGQLAGWLSREHSAGRLACTNGDVDDAVGAAQASLDRAAGEAARLRNALNGALQATAWLCRAATGGEDR
jgi:hypothetical protein